MKKLFWILSEAVEGMSVRLDGLSEWLRKKSLPKPKPLEYPRAVRCPLCGGEIRPEAIFCDDCSID